VQKEIRAASEGYFKASKEGKADRVLYYKQQEDIARAKLKELDRRKDVRTHFDLRKQLTFRRKQLVKAEEQVVKTAAARAIKKSTKLRKEHNNALREVKYYQGLIARIQVLRG